MGFITGSTKVSPLFNRLRRVFSLKINAGIAAESWREEHGARTKCQKSMKSLLPTLMFCENRGFATETN